jgi:hypothetical protein
MGILEKYCGGKGKSIDAKAGVPLMPLLRCHYRCSFFGVLVFEFRVLHLLGKHSTT